MMESLQIGDDGAPAPKPSGVPETLLFSDQERQILEIYDRLKEVELETAILKAAQSTPSDLPEPVSEDELRAAQEGLLQARALYNLRNTIVDSVLMANPILKAIHATGNATAVERELLPLIHERDSLSVALADTSANILSTTEKLTKAEAEHIVVAQNNAELAAKMIALAEEVNSQKNGDIKDPAIRQEIAELEKSMKTSRQRWRIMKGTASAVVAGSGLDWARDEALRELVMDNDSD